MTPDDLTSPVHFAPYGGTNAICGETVPRSVGVFPDTGEYDDARFTVRRGKATCRECLCRTRRTASPDDLTSRAQVEAERLRPVTGVADDTERRDNLLWSAGYVTGATWAAAQAPSTEALSDDTCCPRCGCPTMCPEGQIEARVAEKISPDAVQLADAALTFAATSVLSQDGATALLRTAQSVLTFMATSEDAEAERDTLTAQLDSLRAGIERLNLHSYLPDCDNLAYLCEDDNCLWWDMTYALQADLRALLAEDET